MRLRSIPHHLLRVASILLLGLALVSVLGGGSCSFCSGSWCDDDDDCWDDDDSNDDGCDDDDEEATAGGSWNPGVDEVLRQLEGLPAGARSRAAAAGAGPASPPWLLEAPGSEGHALAAAWDDEAYRLRDVDVERQEDPYRHPVRRVRVRGLSVLELWGRTTVSRPDFTAFAGRVLAANDALLGLPPWAGRLRPAETHFLDTVVAVVFEQLPPWGDGEGEPLGGAGVTVVFDHLGRLVQIENTTMAPPGSRLPTPAAWAAR